MSKQEKVDLSLLSPEELSDYKAKKSKTAKQALKYALCTASAGLIEFITFSLLTLIPEPGTTVQFIDPLPVVNFSATFVALTFSIIWNFTINRKFTFKSAGNVPRAMFLAFLFYVPFFPFKLWFNGHMPGLIIAGTALTAAALPSIKLVVEICSMLINGVLEFCWQKFFIYRKEEDTALLKYSVGEVGEFGEITPAASTFSGDELYSLLHQGVDINALSDKQLLKILKKQNKA